MSAKNALYILFGQNIGAVIPTLLSTVKTNSESRKAAFVHLWFNVIGSLIFAVICELTPYTDLLATIEDGSLRVSVAHIIFNTVSTVILMPFGDKLALLSSKSEELLYKKC